jgi:uncharacterized coiled-coil protein SlyX
MPRLLKIAQKSALVLTGVTIGAALWKTRAGANDPGEAGPLKESVTDLEFRLAALENGGLRVVSEDREQGSAAHTLSAVASLEASVAALTTRYDSRLTQLESRVGDHDSKLKEVPTLAQVVSTMEAMLSSTMSGLDQKLSEQVRSIDVLKTTVAQSDELMERVLDSIYSLQSHVAENDKSEVPVSV